MGFINDLKKAFFGAKSVAQSAGREAVEKGKELKKETEEWLDDLKKEEPVPAEEPLSSTEPLDEPVSFEPSKDVEADLFKTAEEELEKTPPIQPGAFDQAAEKIREFAEDAGKKLQDTADEISERLLDENREEDPEWLKKAKENTESVGEKVMETGEKAWDKAKELGKDLKGKFDDLVDKANLEVEKEKLEEELKKVEKTAEEVAEQVKKDTKDGGLLKKHESFFDKAARFAEGDYRAEGEMRIEKSDAPEEEKKADNRTVKGFEDLDGDGDEIIDDAILDK